MQPPDCKVCGEKHWRPPCPKFAKKGKATAAAIAGNRVQEIAARPVTLGAKGRTKKAKAAKKSSTKQAARRQAAEKTAKSKPVLVDENPAK